MPRWTHVTPPEGPCTDPYEHDEIDEDLFGYENITDYVRAALEALLQENRVAAEVERDIGPGCRLRLRLPATTILLVPNGSYLGNILQITEDGRTVREDVGLAEEVDDMLRRWCTGLLHLRDSTGARLPEWAETHSIPEVLRDWSTAGGEWTGGTSAIHLEYEGAAVGMIFKYDQRLYGVPMHEGFEPPHLRTLIPRLSDVLRDTFREYAKADTECTACSEMVNAALLPGAQDALTDALRKLRACEDYKYHLAARLLPYWATGADTQPAPPPQAPSAHFSVGIRVELHLGVQVSTEDGTSEETIEDLAYGAVDQFLKGARLQPGMRAGSVTVWRVTEDDSQIARLPAAPPQVPVLTYNYPLTADQLTQEERNVTAIMDWWRARGQDGARHPGSESDTTHSRHPQFNFYLGGRLVVAWCRADNYDAAPLWVPEEEEQPTSEHSLQGLITRLQALLAAEAQ